MISETDIIIRLVVACLLGAAVGLERELHSQPAGLRTHIILSLGSALAMCVSIRLAMDYIQEVPNGDPARLAAQVISGIGFLGAGAIMRYGTSIKGLTTATSLWTIAIIGLAVGAGHFVSATAATGLLLTTLVILDVFEKKYIRGSATRTIHFGSSDHPHVIHEFEMVLMKHKIETKTLNIDKSVTDQKIEIEAIVKIPQTASIDQVIAELSSIEGAQRFEVE